MQKEKRNLIFFITNICNYAGTERAVVNLCNYLASDFELTICSLSTKSGIPFYDINSSIRINHLGLIDYEKEDSRTRRYISKSINTFKIAKILRGLKADIFIGTSKNVNIYLSLFSRKKQRVIGCEHFPAHRPMSNRVKVLRNIAYRNLDELIVLTTNDKEFYLSKGINTSVIPNFLSFYPHIDDHSRNKIVLAVARHSEEKRLDILLKIWSKVITVHKDWKLKIIGDGELYEKNYKLCRELKIFNSVEFRAPLKDIINEYLSSQLFAMTSSYEAFPMVLLEAMACKLTCISFDCDTGPREIIKNNEDGILVEMNNIDKYTEELIKLIDDKHRLERYSSSARKNIQRFDLSVIGERWHTLLTNHLN